MIFIIIFFIFSYTTLRRIYEVNNNDSETIANIIKPEFPDTKSEDLIIAIEQYKKTNIWPETTK